MHHSECTMPRLNREEQVFKIEKKAYLNAFPALKQEEVWHPSALKYGEGLW